MFFFSFNLNTGTNDTSWKNKNLGLKKITPDDEPPAPKLSRVQNKPQILPCTRVP